MPSGSPPVGPSSVDRVPSERGFLKGAEGSEGAAWPPGRPLLETGGIAEAAVKPVEGGELISSGKSKQSEASRDPGIHRPRPRTRRPPIRITAPRAEYLRCRKSQSYALAAMSGRLCGHYPDLATRAFLRPRGGAWLKRVFLSIRDQRHDERRAFLENLKLLLLPLLLLLSTMAAADAWRPAASNLCRSMKGRDPWTDPLPCMIPPLSLRLSDAIDHPCDRLSHQSIRTSDRVVHVPL
eukprot:COSAG05_NODE_945_length_6487_cov_3.519568_3_plen_238_part_00